MSDSDPDFLESLFADMEAEIQSDVLALPTPSVWGLRMVFDNEDGSGERIALMYPSTFPSQELAEELSDALSDADNAETNSQLFKLFASKGRMAFPSGKSWLAVYQTVVELQVVPF